MNTASILIVEDDNDIASLLEYAFAGSGFSATRRDSGEAALETLRKQPVDLVVLDVMLPGIDGMDVLKAIRRDPRLAGTAVIMLTARGEEMDRVVGLELGADDYVVKPFSVRELVLRAKGLLGRSRAKEESPLLASGPLQVDLAAHRAMVDGADIDLTATEFKLLTELMRHQGQALDRDRLLAAVWGYTFDGYARTVDTHMRRLRQKLGTASDMIETLRGVGYRFKSTP